jgi:hypothetical protein
MKIHKKDYSKSPFKKQIRIKESQLKKLGKYKETATMAGYLDIILNAHWASMEVHKYQHYLIGAEKHGRSKGQANTDTVQSKNLG